MTESGEAGRPRRAEPVLPEDIDLGPWVGASPDDQTPDGDFRRAVAAVAREVLAAEANRRLGVNGAAAETEPGRVPGPAETGCEGPGGRDAGRGLEPGEPSLAGAGEKAAAAATAEAEEADWLSRVAAPSAPPPGHFDLRESTPFLLAVAYRRLTEGLAASGAGSGSGWGTGVLRELVLLEAGRLGGFSPGRLGVRLGVPASTVTGLVEWGVRVGYLERTRHRADRRSWRLVPTESGLARASEVAERWRRADERLLRVLTPRERDQLRRLLRLVAG